MKDLTVEYLQNKFNIYNKKFFKGELPAIKIKLSRSKHSLGQFSWSYLRDDPSRTFGEHIKISTYYDLPAKEIQDTLIHEMIHYYIHYKKIKDTASHGYYFTKIAEEINSKTSYNISATAQLDNPKLNTNKTKIYRIIKFVDEKGRTCFGRISKNFDYEYFIKQYHMTNVEVFESKNTMFDDWREGRSNLRYQYGQKLVETVNKTMKKTIYRN